MSAKKNHNQKKLSSFDISQTDINREEIVDDISCPHDFERNQAVKLNLKLQKISRLASLTKAKKSKSKLINEQQLFGLLIGHQCSQFRSWKKSEIELFTQLALQSGLALEKLRLQEELFLTQNTYFNEVEKQPAKANNFPKKISELQKISQLLVENQTALQQLKLKTSHQSTSKNSLINPVQDINQEL